VRESLGVRALPPLAAEKPETVVKLKPVKGEADAA
jgi:recombination protein RecA